MPPRAALLHLLPSAFSLVTMEPPVSAPFRSRVAGFGVDVGVDDEHVLTRSRSPRVVFVDWR